MDRRPAHLRAPFPLMLLLVGAPLLAACEGGPPWGRASDDAAVAADREGFGPAAAYDRRLLFLGPGTELPTAAVFDFAALTDSATLRRGVRARVVDGEEWVPLVDAGWEMEPMREPWRLVPHGPLRVVVGDAGDLDALLVRGEDMVARLEMGPAIAEYSPDAGTQLVLRQGRLRLGDEPVLGILLDAQLARAVNPAALQRAADPGPTDSAAAGMDPDEPVEAAPGDEPGTDSVAAAPPNPAPWPGAEALLLDNSGYYVVFAPAGDGNMAWIHDGGRDDVRRGARLDPIQWESFPEGGVDVPTAWRVVSPGGGFGGELRAEAASRSMLQNQQVPGAIGYVVVAGWVEDGGVRRNVYGLIRHVR